MTSPVSPEVTFDIGSAIPPATSIFLQRPGEFFGFEHRKGRQAIDEFRYVSRNVPLDARS